MVPALLRDRVFRRYWSGSVVTRRIAARIGVGWAYTAGCLLFTAPLLLWPLAHGGHWLVLAMLFAAGCSGR